jgi:TonB family protein
MYATQPTDPRTRVVGIAVSLCATALVAWTLTSAVAKTIIVPPNVIPILDILRDQREVQPETNPIPVDASEESLAKPEPLNMPVFEDFIIEDPAAALPVTAVASPGAEPRTPAKPNIPRTSPRLLARDKPAYPPPSIRAEEQGDTTLRLCIGANGRVTEAQIARSSGHRRLDEAALAWVKTSRFQAGASGGRATAMCGHELTYQWRLTDLH